MEKNHGSVTWSESHGSAALSQKKTVEGKPRKDFHGEPDEI